jgi:hypothetical protein
LLPEAPHRFAQGFGMAAMESSTQCCQPGGALRQRDGKFRQMDARLADGFQLFVLYHDISAIN